MTQATETYEIHIDTETIRLDQLLKLSTIADTGGFAKLLIKEGYVRVNGIMTTQRGKKCIPGDQVELLLPTEEGTKERLLILVTG